MDKLADAIEKFYEEKNNENLNTVVQEIMRAKLTAPVQVDVTGLRNADKLAAGGPVQPHKDMQIKLLNLSRDGKNFLPVFSGKAQMEKAPQASTIELSLQAYGNALKDPKIEGILVNPFSKSFFINKELLGAMLNAMSNANQSAQQPKQQKNIRVSFFEPEPYPTDMVYGARLVLMCQDNVKSAYLLGMKNEETAQSTYLFILKFDDGASQEDIKKVFDSMNKEIQSYKPQMSVSFMINNNPLAKKATDGKKPFFRRYDDEEYEAEKNGVSLTAEEEKPASESAKEIPAKENTAAEAEPESAAEASQLEQALITPTPEHSATDSENTDSAPPAQKKSWFKKLFGKGEKH